jgi:hypothetical protein
MYRSILILHRPLVLFGHVKQDSVANKMFSPQLVLFLIISDLPIGQVYIVTRSWGHIRTTLWVYMESNVKGGR